MDLGPKMELSCKVQISQSGKLSDLDAYMQVLTQLSKCHMLLANFACFENDILELSMHDGSIENIYIWIFAC